MNEPAVSHPWDLIKDLPSDWKQIGRPDLDDILELWKQQRSTLIDDTKVKRLEERLATRWSIETGIIERLYTIDRGTTETLVELGLGAIQRFSTSGRISQETMRLIEDQRAALDFVFAYIKEERPLSLSYIKELHQLLLQNQVYTEAVDQFGNRFQVELVRGDWKKLPNNPLTPDGTIHEYCPPDFVQDEMESLIRFHGEHVAKGVRPEVQAAWLHHRFTQIHPFQDGNGRVARTIATMIMLKAGFLPLVIRDIEHRESYLNALSVADNGEIGSLINLFSNIQAQDLNDAITFVREMRGEGIRQIATAAANAAKLRLQQDEEKIQDTTNSLMAIAQSRLEEVAFELRDTFRENGINLDAEVWVNTPEQSGWWNQQIVNAAQTYQYFAELSRFRRWTQIRLRVPSLSIARWQLVISFHHKESRVGLMAAVAFLTTSDPENEDMRPGVLGSEYEFSYSSSSSGYEDEFRAWLNRAVQVLLEAWQSRI